jgi:hypothetical protein
MALGRAQAGQDFDNPWELLGDRLREGSLYRLLADSGMRCFRTVISLTCMPGR